MLYFFVTKSKKITVRKVKEFFLNIRCDRFVAITLFQE